MESERYNYNYVPLKDLNVQENEFRDSIDLSSPVVSPSRKPRKMGRSTWSPLMLMLFVCLALVALARSTPWKSDQIVVEDIEKPLQDLVGILWNVS
jgi:hypothetical protein